MSAAPASAVQFKLGNPFRFRGKGTAQVAGGELVLEGPRLRPFWFSRPTQVSLPLDLVQNVRQQGGTVAFDTPGKRTPGTTTMVFESEPEAAAFAAALPRTVSQDFLDRQAFETRLAAASRGTPVAWTLLALNVLVFAAFSYLGGGVAQADGEMLIRWGSNFGPYTTDGQWWRLLSAAFLHGGLVHLFVNMFTLYDFGRMSERLFGSGAFLAIYLLSALAGSAASVWWNPSVNSVGASGALFGVLGAVLVYMLDKRNGVPPQVMTAHVASLAIFVAYGIFNGLARTGIDNAAHLGGLAGGAIAGFALARPLGDAPAPSAMRRATGVAACLALILGLAFLTPGSRGSHELEQRFIADLKWLTAEERPLVAAANEIFTLAKAGTPDQDIAPRVKALAERWAGAHARLSAYRIAPPSRLAPLHEDMLAYVDARSRAFATMAQVFDEPSQSKLLMAEFGRLMKEGDAAVERAVARDKAARKK